MKEKNMKLSLTPAILAIILLLLTFLNWPYNYYNFLRIVITIISVYYAYSIYKISKELSFWPLALVSITILFNPISPIYLGDKTIWGIVDVIVAVFFISLIIKLKNERIN